MTIPEDMGITVPSEHDDVIEALEEFCPNRTFVDLGSGFGDVVAWAAQCGAINPRGIEYKDIATDIQDDFFNQDILQYDVIYYFFIGNRQDIALFKLLLADFQGIFILNKRFAEGCTTDVMLGEPIATLGTAKVYDFRPVS